MMQIQRDGDHLRLVLAEEEAKFLAPILRAVAAEYAIPPPELDAKVQGVWYSSEGMDRVQMPADERREWEHALHEFRGENSRKIGAWLAILAQTAPVITWSLEGEDVERLMIVLNDHRLSLAARHDVAEQEMEHDLDRIESPGKKQALFHIHILGAMIHRIIEEMGGAA